jgi:serine phosphatase RsbU (regulator of sigma subunit)
MSETAARPAAPVAPVSPESPHASRMQCMQVWGGTSAANEALSTAGLDVWLYSKPYRDHASGGDLYYLSSCSSGRITRLVLADVRGHGEGVAGLARTLRTLLQAHINHVSQQTLVREINREFAAAGDPTTFATGLIGTYFRPTGRLSLTNAGHPPPLFFSARDRQWRPVDGPASDAAPTNVPLGMFAHADYTEQAIRMQPGDLLFCFTDGLDECLGPDGEPLGREGIYRMVSALEVLALAPTNLFDDDATILLLRANQASVSVADNLLAPFRYVRWLLGLWNFDQR